MALKIRLRKQGRNNRQTFRLVVTDVREPRDGKYIEMLGWYNPFQDKDNAKVNAERVSYWISQGAEVTENAGSLLKNTAPAVIQHLRALEMKRREKKREKRKALRKKSK